MRWTLPTEELGLVPQSDPEAASISPHPLPPKAAWVGPMVQRKEVKQMSDTPHGVVVCDSRPTCDKGAPLRPRGRGRHRLP